MEDAGNDALHFEVGDSPGFTCQTVETRLGGVQVGLHASKGGNYVNGGCINQECESSLVDMRSVMKRDDQIVTARDDVLAYAAWSWRSEER